MDESFLRRAYGRQPDGIDEEEKDEDEELKAYEAKQKKYHLMQRMLQRRSSNALLTMEEQERRSDLEEYRRQREILLANRKASQQGMQTNPLRLIGDDLSTERVTAVLKQRAYDAEMQDKILLMARMREDAEMESKQRAMALAGMFVEQVQAATRIQRKWRRVLIMIRRRRAELDLQALRDRLAMTFNSGAPPPPDPKQEAAAQAALAASRDSMRRLQERVAESMAGHMGRITVARTVPKEKDATEMIRKAAASIAFRSLPARSDGTGDASDEPRYPAFERDTEAMYEVVGEGEGVAGPSGADRDASPGRTATWPPSLPPPAAAARGSVGGQAPSLPSTPGPPGVPPPSPALPSTNSPGQRTGASFRSRAAPQQPQQASPPPPPALPPGPEAAMTNVVAGPSDPKRPKNISVISAGAFGSFGGDLGPWDEASSGRPAPEAASAAPAVPEASVPTRPSPPTISLDFPQFGPPQPSPLQTPAQASPSVRALSPSRRPDNNKPTAFRATSGSIRAQPSARNLGAPSASAGLSSRALDPQAFLLDSPMNNSQMVLGVRQELSFRLRGPDTSGIPVDPSPTAVLPPSTSINPIRRAPSNVAAALGPGGGPSSRFLQVEGTAPPGSLDPQPSGSPSVPSPTVEPVSFRSPYLRGASIRHKLAGDSAVGRMYQSVSGMNEDGGPAGVSSIIMGGRLDSPLAPPPLAGFRASQPVTGPSMYTQRTPTSSSSGAARAGVNARTLSSGSMRALDPSFSQPSPGSFRNTSPARIQGRGSFRKQAPWKSPPTADGGLLQEASPAGLGSAGGIPLSFQSPVVSPEALLARAPSSGGGSGGIAYSQVSFRARR